MNGPVFVVGQRVRCLSSGPYRCLTEGKEYTITYFEPAFWAGTYQFPNYAGVIGDFGKQVESYSWRFVAIDNTPCEPSSQSS